MSTDEATIHSQSSKRIELQLSPNSANREVATTSDDALNILDTTSN